MRFCLAAILSILPGLAPACDLALLMAVDVSGSVDAREYEVQMRGIAEGLRDPIVSEALVRGQAHVSLMQWTGSSRQHDTLGWHRISDFDALTDFAAAVETAPRQWRNYATAIGEAQEVALASFAQVPNCMRKVIDVSGDGHSNEGIEPNEVRGALRAAGITVNGLAIEGAEDDLTGYYWENVIGGHGAFVVTADGFEDFAEKMKLKLRKEVVEQISMVLPQP